MNDELLKIVDWLTANKLKRSYDLRSYESNFCNCIEKPEKFRTSTGFKPVTSRFRCDALHRNRLFIMPITMLYFKLYSVLMFDVYNNTALHNISHLFIHTQQIHSYSTRSSSSGNYYISHSRLNQKNDSFSIMGAKIWNSIPENLRNSSKSLFN